MFFCIPFPITALQPNSNKKINSSEKKCKSNSTQHGSLAVHHICPFSSLLVMTLLIWRCCRRRCHFNAVLTVLTDTGGVDTAMVVEAVTNPLLCCSFSAPFSTTTGSLAKCHPRLANLERPTTSIVAKIAAGALSYYSLSSS